MSIIEVRPKAEENPDTGVYVGTVDGALLLLAGGLNPQSVRVKADGTLLSSTITREEAYRHKNGILTPVKIVKIVVEEV